MTDEGQGFARCPGSGATDRVRFGWLTAFLADAAYLERTSADGISPERAVAWLRALSATRRAAEVPAEKADLLHAIYDRIVVAGRRIVSVRLTPSAYAHGCALALPEMVAVARPTGVERVDAINAFGVRRRP